MRNGFSALSRHTISLSEKIKEVTKLEKTVVYDVWRMAGEESMQRYKNRDEGTVR